MKKEKKEIQQETESNEIVELKDSDLSTISTGFSKQDVCQQKNGKIDFNLIRQLLEICFRPVKNGEK